MNVLISLHSAGCTYIYSNFLLSNGILLWTAEFLYKQNLDYLLFTVTPIFEKPRYAQTLHCFTQVTHGKVINQPCVINRVAQKWTFQIPLTPASLASVQIWANDRGKHIPVGGQAELKVHFMNIRFHHETQLCCGSFISGLKSAGMTLLTRTYFLIWGRRYKVQKQRSAFT